MTESEEAAAELFTYEDPPPRPPRASAAALRRATAHRPGQWVKIGKSYANRTSAAELRQRLGGGFEVTARPREDGRFDVYVRQHAASVPGDPT